MDNGYDRTSALRELNLEACRAYTQEDIKRAYKQRVLECHPDKSKGSNEGFIRVKQAYEFLSTADDLDTKTVFRDLAKFFCKVVAEYMYEKPTSNESKDGVNTNCNFKPDDEFYDSNSSFEVTLKIKVPLKDLYREEGKRLVYKYKHEDGTMKSQHVYVSFRDYSLKSTFPQKGDWDSYRQEYGDLIVDMTIVQEGAYVLDANIDRLDLTRVVWMSIGDFYSGFVYSFDHFGESVTVKVDSPQTIYDCSCIFPGKGLKSSGKHEHRGDLIVLFKVDLTHHKVFATSCEESYKEEHEMFVELVKDLFPSMLSEEEQPE